MEDLPSEVQLAMSMVFALLFYPLQALGIGLLVCTMRIRNGYRGLHEFLSGTRVVLLPAQERRRPVRTERLDQALTQPAGCPQRIGPFTIRGAMRWEPQAKVLLGDDTALERQVVIYLRPGTQPPLDIARRELTRSARLRWLAGGRREAEQWDAFLAPAGRLLPDLVADEGRLLWPEVRAILEHLTAELATAAKEGTLPASLGVHQVRVESNGQVQLLDWPLKDTDQPVWRDGCEVAPRQQALALVGQAAALALEGRLWRPEDSQGSRRFHHTPLPEHAAGLLARLLGFQKPYQDVQEFETELAATRDRPADVTRARRAAHVALLTAFIFLVVSACMLPAGAMSGFLPVMVLAAELERDTETLHDLEEGAWREFAVSAVSPDPKARLHGLVQLDADLRLRDQLQNLIERQTREREARLRAMSSVMTTFIRLMDKTKEQQKAELRAELIRSPVGGSPDFRWLARHRVSFESPMRAAHWPIAVIYTISLAFWPVLWVLWAFLWRGGLSFRWLGL